MKKKKIFLLLLGVFFWVEGISQTRTVNGNVYEDSGEPAIGATVKVTGTNIGTLTGVDGEFSLEVPTDAETFTISGVQYETIVVAIEDNLSVSISMADNLIDGVVVTALGLERQKAALGYGTNELSAEDLSRSGEYNVVQALSSKAPGIQVTGSGGTPGASTKIVFRGPSTITGSNDPLIIVDGVPINNDTRTSVAGDFPFNENLANVNSSNRAVDIDPNDIESVTILKGPAAAALYGARAGNGVIIYTTKRGKAGKLKVDISSNFELSEVNNLPGLQSTYAQGNDGVFQTASQGANGFTSGGTSSVWGPRISDDPSLRTYDNLGNFYETAASTRFNAALSGGSEKGRFRLAFGRNDIDGVIPNSDLERTNVRMTGDMKAGKWTIGGTASYSLTEGTRVQNGSNLAGISLGLFRAPATFDIRDYQYENGFNRSYFFPYDNTFYTAYENPFTDRVSRIIGSTTVKYDFKEWLNFTANIGADAYTDARRQVYAISSYGNDNSDGSGQVNYNTLEQTVFYTDLILGGNVGLKDNLNMNYNFGYNVRSDQFQDEFLRGRTLSIQNFYNLSNASELYSSNYIEDLFTNALFAQAEFDYGNLLYLTLTGRQEWASSFGADDRGFFYPSASVSWLPSSTFENIPDWMNFSKIRYSYGQAGIFPLPYRTQTVFSRPTITDGFTNGLSFPYGGQNGFNVGILGSSNLKPEVKTGHEVGVELGLFNRITFEASYYNEKTEDLLINVPLPPGSGFEVLYTNIAEVVNKGVELLIDADLVEKEDFKWNVTANWATNDNEVLSLASGVDEVSLESAFSSIGSFAIVGQPLGAFFGTQWVRNDQGELIIGSNGLPSLAPNTGNVGNPLPDWLAGFRNTIEYKGFTLSALLDIRQGGDIWNGTRARLNRLGQTDITADRERMYIVPGVKEDGTPNDIEIDARTYFSSYLGDGGGAQEQFVEDGSWVRLRDVNLSYRLPSQLVEKTPLSNATFTLTGRNLWLSTDYTGVDPETSLTGAGSNIGGLDYFNNPGTRSYALTLNLGF